jgi:hypothetical protein
MTFRDTAGAAAPAVSVGNPCYVLCAFRSQPER